MNITAFEPLIKALIVESLKTKGGHITVHTARAVIRDHADDIIAAARAEVDEEWHRWFLWETCTHEMKYGDDGEMQCSGVDFRRDEMWRLQQHVQEAINDRNKDLIELRARNIDLTVKLSGAEADALAYSKRIERLEDLLNNVYRGPIGFAFPRDTDILQIGRELGIR